MSPAIKGKKTPTPKKFDFAFIQYDFNPEEKKAFKQWAHENIDGMFDLLTTVTEQGYGVSVKHEAAQGCYACFITPKGADHKHQGWILPGRGSTVFAAMAGALYRHLVLFEDQWPMADVFRGGLDDE